MNPLWFVAAISSVFGGVSSYQAGKEMEGLADQQALMAEENAVLEKRELDEQVRRQANKDAQVRGKNLARAAASGRRIEGSLDDYLSYVEGEQTRELDWTKTAGASRIRLNKQAGLLQAKSTRIKAKASKRELVTGLLGGLSMLGASGMFSGGASAGYSNNGWNVEFIS